MNNIKFEDRLTRDCSKLYNSAVKKGNKLIIDKNEVYNLGDIEKMNNLVGYDFVINLIKILHDSCNK